MKLTSRSPARRRTGTALPTVTATPPAFLLRTKQDGAAARRFPARAINPHGVPENIGIDTSGANTATIESSQSVRGNGIQMRQLKGLNNLVEPDHRATKNPCAPCSD